MTKKGEYKYKPPDHSYIDWGATLRIIRMLPPKILLTKMCIKVGELLRKGKEPYTAEYLSQMERNIYGRQPSRELIEAYLKIKRYEIKLCKKPGPGRHPKRRKVKYIDMIMTTPGNIDMDKRYKAFYGESPNEESRFEGHKWRDGKWIKFRSWKIKTKLV